MKKKIYIAGKVSGMNYIDCALKFKEAIDPLRHVGFIPINPLEVVNDSKCDWKKAMRLCVAELTKVDAVFLLDNYTDSVGALLERKLAAQLGIPVFTEIQELCKHFGNVPELLCGHSRTRSRVVFEAAGCEDIETVCEHCGKVMSTKTEC